VLVVSKTRLGWKKFETLRFSTTKGFGLVLLSVVNGI